MEKGGEVSKVDRGRVVACMTCPLCNKLFEEATTISECLHTFCRKCIYAKISAEELRTCPVCNTDIGYPPLEKLRPDNNWQDIRVKIFPLKEQNSRQPEEMPLVQTPARRKERSLSSLVVSTPRVSAKSDWTGRRTRLDSKKAITNQESPSRNKEHVLNHEEHPQFLSLPETNSKGKDFPVGESSKQYVIDRSSESTDKALEEDKADLWKPLNCLVEEAADKTKNNRVNTQGSTSKPASDVRDNEENLPTVEESGGGSNIPIKENVSTPELSISVGTRRSGRQKSKPVSERSSTNIPAHAVVDSRNKHDARYSPIWFSLVASDDVQDGGTPLPQISSCYIRVKDGNLPVSSIKKYLVKKLHLSSETELEISLHGQPVLSTMQLHNLVDWWAQTTPPSEKIQTSVGSSAKDFVMVLSYSRKAQPK